MRPSSILARAPLRTPAFVPGRREHPGRLVELGQRLGGDVIGVDGQHLGALLEGLQALLVRSHDREPRKELAHLDSRGDGVELRARP